MEGLGFFFNVGGWLLEIWVKKSALLELTGARDPCGRIIKGESQSRAQELNSSPGAARNGKGRSLSNLSAPAVGSGSFPISTDERVTGTFADIMARESDVIGIACDACGN